MKLLQLLVGLEWHSGFDSHNQPVHTTSFSAVRFGRAHAVRGTTTEGSPPHVEACTHTVIKLLSHHSTFVGLLRQNYSQAGAKTAAGMALVRAPQKIARRKGRAHTACALHPDTHTRRAESSAPPKWRCSQCGWGNRRRQLGPHRTPAHANNRPPPHHAGRPCATYGF
jgi:hypothetical protein